jgi:hypothetical protein
MIKNFLASAVGLRKETVPVSVNYAVEEDGKKILKAGTLVPVYTELVGATPRYAVLFNDTDVTDKTEGAVSVGGVTRGHILRDVIIEAEQPQEQDLIAQGLYMENYKEAQYPEDSAGNMITYRVEKIDGEITGGDDEEQGGGGGK